MSRRLLTPSNVFYRQADPLPPLFAEPQEGDIYLNTYSGMLRVFLKGSWKNASADTIGFWKQWTGSEEEYDAIVEKDPNVLYVIV